MSGQADAGMMVVVVGPSGAGKDSVIAYAARHFAGNPRLALVRRIITRPPDGGFEAHEAVGVEEFARRRAEGAFAVSWEAHGLCYAFPRETLDMLDRGMTLVANGSRAALPAIAAAYPRLRVVTVTARPDILAARLAARGREGPEAIAGRLRRAVAETPGAMVIDNSGALAEAGATFIALLEETLERSPQTG
ncbi:phosphonate metabolism protein/1,5-bisphosphokinase (PRPP-forming) PhnN [Shinella daejeonensis]|nr:phosphonate metabolism protein/1,5-bisphosphokinase (PRPP-forming) PhnN [Shinella daejeonensis]